MSTSSMCVQCRNSAIVFLDFLKHETFTAQCFHVKIARFQRTSLEVIAEKLEARLFGLLRAVRFVHVAETLRTDFLIS